MKTILTNYALRKETGAGSRLAGAVMAFAAADFNVEYVTLQPPGIEHENVTFNILASPGLPTDGVPDHHSPGFWAKYMVNASRECLRSARRADTALLVAFTFGGSIPLLLASLLTGKPLIVFLRSDESNELRMKSVRRIWRTLFRAVENMAVSRAALLIPVTSTLADTIVARHGGKTRAKISILYNNLPGKSCDIPDCRKKIEALTGADGSFTFAACSSLTPGKNNKLLLKAFADCKGNRATLLIIGDGEELHDLRKLAGDLNIADRVVFTLWRNDAAELVAGCDLFLHPSLAEGMSNSLLEALASGVPCLVSDIPEHRELFHDPSCLFDPMDAEGLAVLMQKSIADKEFIGHLRYCSKKVGNALSFDWDREIVNIAEQCAR